MKIVSWFLVGCFLLVSLPAQAGFRVSSFMKEARLNANAWNAASAIDGKLDTCWMVDPEAENIGQWFELDLPMSEVSGLSMHVGWEKSEETFLDYPRVKTVKIEVFTEEESGYKSLGEHSLSFEDKVGAQKVSFAPTKVGSELYGGRVRITIVDMYKGKDYPALAVSEIMVHLKEMDAHSTLVTAPASSAKGHDAALLVDKNPRAYWAAGEGATQAEMEIKAEGFGVSGLGVQPGPTSHARPKTLRVTVNNVTKTYTMKDRQVMQWFTLPAVTGYSGSAWGEVKVEVVDVYPARGSGGVAIGELSLRATNFEGL